VAAWKSHCAILAAEYARQVAEGRHIAAELVAHASLQAPKPGPRTFVSEKDFVAGLMQQGADKAKTTLVLARGGTGKSTLAAAIEAQTCEQLDTFRIDLMTDIAARGETFTPGQNRIAERISELLQLPNVGGPETALRTALAGKPCLVVLDSLDEVPVVRRPGIANEIDDFVTRALPGVRVVVLTRPPVFNSDYGLKTLGARFEIPQMSCAETDVAITRTIGEAKERENFIEFVHYYGIDRKVQSGGACYHPHLSTWRDLQVVQKLAQSFGYDKAASSLKDFESARSQVYTIFAAAQLERDLKAQAMAPAEALGVVDRMVAAHDPSKGQRNLAFTMQDCLTNIGPKALAPQPSCERLLQSSLFTKTAEGEWRFDNQSLGDLFLARWTSASLTTQDKVDCAAIEERSSLLESSEIAGFLVGQSAGQTCLAEVAVALCARAGYAQNVFEQLDQGLPAGPGRANLVTAAGLKLDNLRPDPCARALLDRLEAGAPKPAGVAPVPAAKEAPLPAKKRKTR